ncbi:YcxB family protein [Apibacter sp. HY039]|uniref:YcxB family protein n=1 Tax=Apibacter sp. HY039 TaxID=2501476 RepID=UPI000FEC03B3|nr:YcxB family protein [Apibacter sp. HY039]
MKESLFTYQITADDYLTHQLFSASINSFVKKQRRRGLILWTSTFFIMALFFYVQKNTYLAIYFSLFGLGFIFIYPIYSRWIYKRYYKRLVNKNFNQSNIENLSLTIGSDLTITSGKDSGKIEISDIETIYELPTHVFIKLNGGRNIIVPKRNLINSEELTERIYEIAQENSIEILKFPRWKWR